MSYDSARYILETSKSRIFSGGFVDNIPDYTLEVKDTNFIRNGRIDGIGVSPRPGHNQFSDILTGGTFPKGIASYLRAISADDRLIVNHNAGLVSVADDGTQTVITNTITADVRMSFSNIGDVLYCMNGIDEYGKLVGTTYTEPATGLSAFAPAFGEYFDNSHWVSGDISSSRSNIVFKSVGDNSDNFTGTGADQFTFPEQVTGVSTAIQRLFVFTENQIHMTSGITDVGGTAVYTFQSLQVKEGANNDASIVAAGNSVYYLTPSNKIKRVSPGNGRVFDTTEVSHKKFKGIDRIMSTLDIDQVDSFGYFLPNENLIKWHVKTKGSTFNNLCLVYNIELELWLPDNNKIFFDGTHHKGKNFTVSNLEKKIFEDEVGFDDDDQAIQFEYRKKLKPVGSTRRGELWETRTLVELNELANLTQQLKMDGNIVNTFVFDNTLIPISTSGIGTQPIGTYAIGTGGTTAGVELFEVLKIIPKGKLQVKGQTFEVVYRHSTVGGTFRITDFDLRVEQLPPEAVAL